MSVVVKTETEMSFVKVEVAGINSILLNIHGLVEQQLFQSVVQLGFLKEYFELFFEMHHIFSFESDS